MKYPFSIMNQRGIIISFYILSGTTIFAQALKFFWVRHCLCLFVRMNMFPQTMWSNSFMTPRTSSNLLSDHPFLAFNCNNDIVMCSLVSPSLHPSYNAFFFLLCFLFQALELLNVALVGQVTPTIMQHMVKIDF